MNIPTAREKGRNVISIKLVVQTCIAVFMLNLATSIAYANGDRADYSSSSSPINTEVRDADLVLCCDEKDNIDIGFRRAENKLSRPILFSAEQLVYFLECESRKQSAVVCSKSSGNRHTKVMKMLKKAGFAKVFFCTLDADTVFSLRRSAKREPLVNHGKSNEWKRTVYLTNNVDELNLNIGAENRRLSSAGEHVLDRVRFTRQEILSFFQQDSRRNILVLKWGKRGDIDERDFDSFVKAGGYQKVTFEHTFNTFQVPGKLINKSDADSH